PGSLVLLRPLQERRRVVSERDPRLFPCPVGTRSILLSCALRSRTPARLTACPRVPLISRVLRDALHTADAFFVNVSCAARIANRPVTVGVTVDAAGCLLLLTSAPRAPCGASSSTIFHRYLRRLG